MPACTTRAPAASSALMSALTARSLPGMGRELEEHRVPALDAQSLRLRLEQLGQGRPRLSLRPGGEDADVVGQAGPPPPRASRAARRAPRAAPRAGPPPRFAPGSARRAPAGGRCGGRRGGRAAPGGGARRRAPPAPGRRPRGMSRSSVSATTRSGGVSPSTSALVESLRRHSASPSASASSRARSVGRASSGVWSSLKSPVCTSVPSGVRSRKPDRVGDGVGHPERLDLEGRRGVERLAREDLPQVGADVHLVEPLGHQRQGEAGAVDRDHALAEQEGQRADVVLVGVGEEHRAELGGRVPEVAEVRDDQLHAGELGRRKEQAGVDEEELVPALEDHRVQADLAQTAEGDDAQHAGLEL